MTYLPRLPPYAHQVEALRRLEGRDAFALLMAMRTGKTKVVLDHLGRLEEAGECRDLLVVAPAGAYRTWLTAAEEHLSEDLADRAVVRAWSSSGGRQDKLQLDAMTRSLDPRRPRVLLVNVEALSAVQRARDLCQAFLSQRPGAMMVVDESTTIKNPLAKRTRYVTRQLAPLAARRLILSGLPTPRSPLDLYSQFEFLDWRFLGFRSYYGFRARYAVMRSFPIGGRSVQLVVGYRDVEELQEKIAPHSYRVLLSDCYDLPPSQYARREVRLTADQARVYREVRDDATSLLSGGAHVTATMVITQVLRMHQVLCGHVVDERGEHHEVPELRTAALLELLGEHDGKAVVWCSYDHDVRKVSSALEAEYGAGSVARFWGGNRPTREEEERRFKSDDACLFMVATAAAGGRGRTWHVADLVVYYSNTPDLEHRSQSEERTQAVGKARPVLYVDLVAPGTVDEKMIAALRNKIDVASTITGDAYREWLV